MKVRVNTDIQRNRINLDFLKEVIKLHIKDGMVCSDNVFWPVPFLAVKTI